jgi:hypothetical protein
MCTTVLLRSLSHFLSTNCTFRLQLVTLTSSELAFFLCNQISF